MITRNFHAETQRRRGLPKCFWFSHEGTKARRHEGELINLLSCAVFVFLTFVAPLPTCAQAGRIYTKPEAADTGAILGRVDEELTHAVAVVHDRVHVYRAELSDEGRAFRFEHLPVGMYDLVLFTKSTVVYEGLALGAAANLPEASAKNLEKRVAVADGFFKTAKIHRTGVSADGETLFAFVERYRVNNILKQSGEALNEMVRRFEVIELARAKDDWQMTSSRHIYREGEPIPANPQFRKAVNVSALGELRVVAAAKDLGEIPLPK